MNADRLKAFSDGVFAIIITITVLDLKVPHGDDFNAIKPLLPIFLSYVLSFLYIGIYWNNHHHMLHTSTRITGGILWANLHLLFWISMFPFANGWMGENHFATLPTAVYGLVLLMAAIAYSILEYTIIKAEGKSSHLARAVGRDFKGKLSIACYIIGIVLAFVNNTISQILYALVALMWLIPDRRIEQVYSEMK